MDIFVTLGMVAVVVVVFYFFGIRPQKKQEQAMAQMRDSLQVGDEITPSAVSSVRSSASKKKR